MHKKPKDTEVILFSNKEFENLILEVKNYLDFNIIIYNNNLDIRENHVFLITSSYFDNNNSMNLKNTKNIKIALLDKNQSVNLNYNQKLEIPISLSDLNTVIKNQYVKKKFSLNSSIAIKEYILDKNEKKLLKDKDYVLLTEREILFLELFLLDKKPITKKDILKKVWKYSEGADTHTVETHVYRLRKKIKKKFDDDNFIINSKDGYSI